MSEPTPQMNELWETTLRQRMNLYRFLRTALLDELTEETLETLSQAEAPDSKTLPRAEIQEVGAEPLAGSEALNSFRKRLRELDEDEQSAMLEDLAGSYGRLFHMNTPESVDPYESIYRNGNEMYGESYTKVKQIMDKLGYDGHEDHPEPADHVAFELGFMAYLSRGALNQYREGNLEYVKRYLNLQDEFLESHMGAWVPNLCEEIHQYTDSEFYDAVARMTQSLVEQDAEMIEALQTELEK